LAGLVGATQSQGPESGALLQTGADLQRVAHLAYKQHRTQQRKNQRSNIRPSSVSDVPLDIDQLREIVDQVDETHDEWSSRRSAVRDIAKEQRRTDLTGIILFSMMLSLVFDCAI
jgi:hypothetical protein